MTATASSAATLIRRYDRPGPRYTSYPTAVEFNGAFDESAYRGRLQAAASNAGDPLSIYVHLPFCAERCSYCGCSVIIARRREIVTRYIDFLERELALLAQHLSGRRRVVQCHWGGGTPTYSDPVELERLHRAICRHFDIEPGAECAVEIDPRVTTEEHLRLLRSLGFNRLSMGVQDFAPSVQEAIGRHQSERVTCDLYEYARRLGFPSINFDLVYGLPRQQRETFAATLDSVVAMRPDRIAVYSYAHVPWLRPHQKAIRTSELPGPQLKLELIGDAIDTFTKAGYVAIGMDHFALPDDELALAAHSRSLHRNFMGYTTRPAADLLGVGVSAIGDVQGAYAQNVKKLPAYYEALEAGRFPIERGYMLSPDDVVRREVISQLMCNFHVDRAAVGRRFGIDFEEYFARELRALVAPGGPVDSGLLAMTADALEVTADGRLFIRTICMQFDRYLAAHEGRPVFSRTV
jgi:oxygen-independent coproporphyrinogen-3 oxidase